MYVLFLVFTSCLQYFSLTLNSYACTCHICVAAVFDCSCLTYAIHYQQSNGVYPVFNLLAEFYIRYVTIQIIVYIFCRYCSANAYSINFLWCVINFPCSHVMIQKFICVMRLNAREIKFIHILAADDCAWYLHSAVHHPLPRPETTPEQPACPQVSLPWTSALRPVAVMSGTYVALHLAVKHFLVLVPWPQCHQSLTPTLASTVPSLHVQSCNRMFAFSIKPCQNHFDWMTSSPRPLYDRRRLEMSCSKSSRTG